MNINLQSGYDMIYLAMCAVNQYQPDVERVKNMNLEELFEICEHHSLTALVCTALEMAGTADKKWIEVKNKSIRKAMMFNAERDKIISFMEKTGIKYMPLKGIIIKDFYPKIGMRQMSDNDIFYDKNYRNELEKFMDSCGYTDKKVGTSNHDTYKKLPIYNFEMHTMLFDEIVEDMNSYYSDISSRMLKDEGNNFGYHFSDEDFYIYITAHEYVHFTSNGTGVRSLVDCYVCMEHLEKSLNWKYIKTESDKLGIAEFEEKRRKLSKKLFSENGIENLTESEKELFECYLFSGTYGKFSNKVSNKLRKIQPNGDKITSLNKLTYITKRLFPDMKFYKRFYPFFYRHKVLLPLCFFLRLYKAIFSSRKKVKRELEILKNK